MKIITLNTWGGKIKKPLEQFIVKYSGEIDVFCFQEVFKNYKNSGTNIFNVQDINPNLFDDISMKLTGYTGYYRPLYENLYGLAIFVKSDIQILEEGASLIYLNKKFPMTNNPEADLSRDLQWVKIRNSTGHEYLILNIHGHWVIEGKSDNYARIEQSKRILKFASKFEIPTIICGDFNLLTNTKSIALLEKNS
jgi:endonuclease/exonuclease/phosphatase family metal-dependent hydrolase